MTFFGLYDTIIATDCTREGVTALSDVTIYTLAKELNMTPAMISRAFNPNARISEEKRKIVLKAAEKYNFTPNKFASRLSMKTVNIGVLINSRFEENIRQMLVGIENAYASLKDYKVKYDINILNPDENTQDDYVGIVNKYKSCDGVILAGMSSAKYIDMINHLYEHTPNIAQVQAINYDVNYLFGSKHNEEIASNLASDFLSQCLKKSERKKIVLFTGDTESALHSSAKCAFEKSCKINDLDLICSVDMKDSEEYFEKIIPGVFEKYQNNIDGIYITSGLSSPLCEYLEKNGIDIPFVAFDIHHETKKYMDKGIISATISQNVSHQMETAFDMLIKYIVTGEEPPKTVFTDVHIVLKSNASQYM